MGVEGVDVGQQGAHHRGNAGTHVLGRQAGKVSEEEKQSVSWRSRSALEVASHSRHGLVDGLDAVAHRKLVHDFLRHVVKVDLPGVVAADFGDFDRALTVDVGGVVEQVLRRTEIPRVVPQICAGILKGEEAADTSCRQVYCTWYAATFSSPLISTLIWRRMAPDTADLSVLFSVIKPKHTLIPN